MQQLLCESSVLNRVTAAQQSGKQGAAAVPSPEVCVEEVGRCQGKGMVKTVLQRGTAAIRQAMRPSRRKGGELVAPLWADVQRAAVDLLNEPIVGARPDRRSALELLAAAGGLG